MKGLKNHLVRSQSSLEAISLEAEYTVISESLRSYFSANERKKRHRSAISQTASAPISAQFSSNFRDNVQSNQQVHISVITLNKLSFRDSRPAIRHWDMAYRVFHMIENSNRV